MPTKFLLSRMPRAGSPFGYGPGGDAHELGRAEQLAELYEEGLRALGATIDCLDAPSIYQTAEAHRAIGIDPASVHLAVRPIAAYRPFHGLPNYLVFNGPLSDLDQAVAGTLRTADRILITATRVFCTTAALADALLARGICNATCVPPPLDPGAAPDAPHISVRAPGVSAGSEAEAVTLDAVAEAGRQSGGQLIYWDAGESADAPSALASVLDAAEKCAGAAAHVSLVISGIESRRIPPPSLLRRFSPRRVYCVEGTPGAAGKKALAQACDIFLRMTPATGLDVEALEALGSGALVLAPKGHSATEFAGSGQLATFDPSLAAAGWGSRSRYRCPDLIGSLRKAINSPASERDARGGVAKDWVRSNHGLDVFAERLKAEMGAS